MIGLTRDNIAIIISYINKLSKAKVLNVKNGEIEIYDDDEVTDVSYMFNDVKKFLKETVERLTDLLRHYNDEDYDRKHYARKHNKDDYDEEHKESLFKDTTRRLDMAISILETVYDDDVIEEGHFECQLYLLKDRLIWLRLVLDMSEEEIEDELSEFDILEIETTRR